MSVDQTMLAVGELIKSQRLRIDVTATVSYTVKAPCLLAQLHEAIGLGSEGGSRSALGSRPNIAVDALDLWLWIVTDTHTWADALGVARRDPRDGHAIPWIGRLLRSCAATALSTGQPEMTDRIGRNADTWARRIVGMLTGQVEQRGVRAAVCPDCHASSVVEERVEERRKAHYRVPAIILVTQRIEGTVGDVKWLTCLACGWYESFNVTCVTLQHTSTSLDVPELENA